MRPVLSLFRFPHLLLAILLGVAVASSLSAAQNESTEAAQVGARVAELIDQLGAPRYVVRQAARQELQGLGLAAFDQLLVAASHPDPEVAAASSRLLETMTVRWTRPDDPPVVRRLLQNYGQASERERRQTLQALSGLSDQQGLAALCRIARFEASERLSREAAIRAIEPHGFAWYLRQALAVRELEIPVARVEAIAAAEQALTSEFGSSQRAAGRWLALFVKQSTNPEGVTQVWEEEVAAEQAANDERKAFTDEVMVDALRWNLFRVQIAASDQEKLLETIDRLILSHSKETEAALTKALEWMVEAGADAGVDALLESRREELTSKGGLYLAATIRHRQGRREEAESLAEKAFQTPPQPQDALRIDNQVALDGRVLAGMRIEANGLVDWAWREYREATNQTPDLSINSIFARWRLSDSLMDHEEYAAAASELTRSIDAIKKDSKSRVLYGHMREQFDRLLPSSTFTARRDYLLARAAKQRGDEAAEVRHLQSAIGHDPTDADIVIAMYRAEGANQAFREETLERIKTLAQQTQKDIDEDPSDPLPYNQWAWLISNTVGDYAKAIRYSKKSLELRRGEIGKADAGFLDTLGRCYFAIGDLERAVEKQREAVRLQPHIQVMQRQLRLFEAALAETRKEES